MSKWYQHKMEEAFNILAGELIGEGQFRQVYSCIVDPSIVIKIEKKTGEFHNVLEWKIWQDFQNRKVSKWLAPCISISPEGVVLLQKRVEPIRKAELPRKLPFFLTDLKIGNFGILDGKIVCHDYAYIRITHKVGTVKADWSE